MTILYGIPNCDSIKKARKWLKDHAVDYEFHDYKQLGVPEKELKKWIKNLGWEVLLNKRGTTWRKLDDSVKNSVDKKSAIQIMLDNPSIIKRPVLVYNKLVSAGFSEKNYNEIFS